jgi:hypothetical protein
VTFGRIATIVTIVVVGGGLAAGFAAIGPPSRARTAALDLRRLDDLNTIADRLRDRGGQLPVFYTGGTGVPRDPATGAPYVYVKESESRYRLCATFAAAGGTDDPYPHWPHPAGAACYRVARGGVVPIGEAFAPPPAEIR